jgi:hypothetical protein
LGGVDTSFVDLKGGTTGQVLAKASNTDLDFVWSATAASGLTLITTQALSGVTSQSINNCFSSTYANYVIVLNAYCATSIQVPTLKLRASGTDSSTGYYGSFFANNWTNNGTSSDYVNNETSWRARPFGLLTTSSTNLGGTNLTLFSPFAATNTAYSAHYLDANTSGFSGFTGGMHNSATSYDGFTITNGTAMTGTIRVYGLAN